MELELKHIQSYPLFGDNGLKVFSNYWSKNKKIGICSISCITNESDNNIGLIGKDKFERYDHIRNIKPLLLPMSSLYTEMEDGKVPIVEIYKKMFIYPQIKEYRIEDNCLVFGKHIFGWVNEFRAFTLDGDTAYITIEVSDYLDENHFDWRYGLIDKGLALDKTKIK